jgi:hypothetical protein
MTRQLRRKPPSNSLSPAEFGDFLHAPPPAFLDALVKQRVGSVLGQRRADLAEQRAHVLPPLPGQKGAIEPRYPALSRTETWSYALGFLAYGAQLADGVARMIWHAMTG